MNSSGISISHIEMEFFCLSKRENKEKNATLSNVHNKIDFVITGMYWYVIYFQTFVLLHNIKAIVFLIIFMTD